MSNTTNKESWHWNGEERPIQYIARLISDGFVDRIQFENCAGEVPIQIRMLQYRVDRPTLFYAHEISTKEIEACAEIDQLLCRIIQHGMMQIEYMKANPKPN